MEFPQQGTQMNTFRIDFTIGDSPVYVNVVSARDLHEAIDVVQSAHDDFITVVDYDVL